MLNQMRRVARVLFVVHVIVGLVGLGAFALAEPLVIGEGAFAHVGQRLETFDFKWWLWLLAAAIWSGPVIAVGVAARTRVRWSEQKRLNDLLLRAFDHSVPITVDIDSRVPVRFEDEVDAAIHLDTKLDLDDVVRVEADIPLDVELPLDTEIETSVLGIGHIRIPIRARIPLRLQIPLRSDVRLRATGVRVRITDQARVTIPEIELPLVCRLETKIDLLTNLDAARRALLDR